MSAGRAPVGARDLGWLDALPRAIDADALPAPIAARFVHVETDATTRAWAANAAAAPHPRWLSAAHALLRRVASDFDVDGWLDTHPLHLLGPEGFRALVGAPPREATLLDVGAGRGDVTAALAPLVAGRVVATETSAPMVRRLRARGYEAHRVDLASAPLPGGPRRFGLVSLLNVLDRCARPRTLLEAARAHLTDDGLALVACPLPLRPHVDVGATTVDPDEPLGVEGERFEHALTSLVTGPLADAGLELVRWTRAPYLARGGHARPIHVLDDGLLVLRRR